MTTTTSLASTRKFWGEDQICGGLGCCTEIWITGGPWPLRLEG